MKSEKIIYIEDEQASIDTYTRSLNRIYDHKYDVIPIMPKQDISDMLKHLENFESIVSYIVDERLNHTGIATYTGSELIKSIRYLDSKIPIYILTSNAAEIPAHFGDIEFVIDKHEFSSTEDIRNELAKKLLRHLNTYNDIKSERAIRLDELLKKSVETELSDDEKKEFDDLNFLRTKSIFLEEQGPSIELREELNKQNRLLSEIEAQLKLIENH
ncbi:hypothetical protein ACO0K3_11230 [Undibacterium sp. Rencai35W]|uniref:hypothetical protein n=1 Tax=Undibacterium sp. Rencai35W TaxID=3413046 RepID=UPI003BF3772F